MIFRIADDLNAASTLADHASLWHAIRRVICALRLDIGSNFANQAAYVGLGENYHRVYSFKRGQNLRTLPLRHEGTSHAFQDPYAVIRIDSNYQFSTESFCGAQITHVPYVQEIEAPVGKRDLIASLPPAVNELAQFTASYDLTGRVRQWDRVAGGAWSRACNNSARDTVAVPRFMTTIPPA